jgi:hypothetical protein
MKSLGASKTDRATSLSLQGSCEAVAIPSGYLPSTNPTAWSRQDGRTYRVSGIPSQLYLLLYDIKAIAGQPRRASV